MFLWEAIKIAFNWSSMPYSLYLTFGFFLSQLLNIQVYKAKGATSLQTWLRAAGILNDQPSVNLVKVLCLIMDIFVFFLCQFLIPEIRLFLPERILTTAVLLSIIFCMISQLIFSSVMRLSYEFSFCFI
jgi:hypothetical protein